MNYDSILIRHEMSGFETEQNIGKIIEREGQLVAKGCDIISVRGKEFDKEL